MLKCRGGPRSWPVCTSANKRGKSVPTIGQKLGDILSPTVNVVNRKPISKVQGPAVCNNQLRNINIVTHYLFFISDRGCPPAMVLRHSSLSTVVEFYGKEDHWDGIGGKITPGDWNHHVFFSSVSHVPQGYVTGMLLHFPLL